MDTTLELQIINELKYLKDILELKDLSKLEELRALSQLDNLEKLKELDHLKALDNIQTLERILKDHEKTLAPIEKLIELRQLNNLDRLKDLSLLEQLSSLKALDKLDLLSDEKFNENLNKLNQLDILKTGSRNLLVQQLSSFFFDILKIIIVSGLMIFFITRESSQEIINKALPAIGLGQSSQVNLGLKLLLEKQTPEEFFLIINDVKSRIQNETNLLFSDSSFVPLSKRLSLLENLKNYSFKTPKIDLKQEVNSTLDRKISIFFSTTINRLEYEEALAKSKDKKNLHNILRETRLLLSQEKFPTALEKSYRYWNSSEALRSAAIISAIKTSLDDPKTLEEIIKNFPPLEEGSL